MPELSVVIITYNEEENIGACIDSVKEVADEVVVLDSFSTDRTSEIARMKGARVVQHVFDGHIEQKNRAKDLATHDYVLSLDADEQLSDELQQSILQAKRQFTADGYTMNRLNFYCGREIKTCGWYPDRKLRLWNRNKGAWGGVNPHDKFMIQSGSEIILLNGNILHYTYPTHEALITQSDKFASIAAEQLKIKSIFYLLVKMIFSPPAKFIRSYLFLSGFREGRAGAVISYYKMREVFLKYSRALKLKMR